MAMSKTYWPSPAGPSPAAVSLPLILKSRLAIFTLKLKKKDISAWK